jgi:hypothetical protein
MREALTDFGWHASWSVSFGRWLWCCSECGCSLKSSRLDQWPLKVARRCGIDRPDPKFSCQALRIRVPLFAQGRQSTSPPRPSMSQG